MRERKSTEDSPKEPEIAVVSTTCLTCILLRREKHENNKLHSNARPCFFYASGGLRQQ